MDITSKYFVTILWTWRTISIKILQVKVKEFQMGECGRRYQNNCNGNVSVV